MCCICVVVPPGLERRCDEDFLKEKGRITGFPKGASPPFFFFYTKVSSVLHLVFFPKWRVAHDGGFFQHHAWLEAGSGRLEMNWFFI